jgi:hypothetical protein
MRRSASEDALGAPRGPPAVAEAAERPAVGRDAPPAPRGIFAAPLSAAVLEARERVLGGRQMRRVASEAELAERRREEALSQVEEFQARRLSNQYASTSAEPAESSTAAEEDRPLLKYLEERPRVNAMESLRLLEATLNMLAPSHQRGEAFKQVCLLWLCYKPSLEREHCVLVGTAVRFAVGQRFTFTTFAGLHSRIYGQEYHPAIRS